MTPIDKKEPANNCSVCTTKVVAGSNNCDEEFFYVGNEITHLCINDEEFSTQGLIQIANEKKHFK